MKKDILIPVLAIFLAAAVLFAASAGLSSIREENTRRELEEMMRTILPGSSAFSQEPYSGTDENIRAAYKAENGYVVHVVTSGYAGDISMLVGVYRDGTVAGLVVRELRETGGLGGRALTDTEFLSQFLNTRGDAAVGDNVDALTGATVTSRAIARGVNAASAFVTGADGASSATTWGG
ncbi:MAG: FMN-binding protein [Candidatus Faecousia sp.]|nr:FMN-binding protein [Candidatus Faecousia sp.]